MLIHEMREKKMRSLKKMYIMLRSKIKKKKYLILLFQLLMLLLNAKINEVKTKILNITNLATTSTALTSVKNIIPSISITQ